MPPKPDPPTLIQSVTCKLGGHRYSLNGVCTDCGKYCNTYNMRGVTMDEMAKMYTQIWKGSK